MLVKTAFFAPIEIIEDRFTVGKHSLTVPTGNFFYDPWQLKDEYKGTAWETILNTLPSNTGEARVITLESPSCYTQHADIDDRYHLNLSGSEDYLIDLTSHHMYKLIQDGIWYEIDAGRLHTAISIGDHIRMQLVVRKLLNKNILKKPVNVCIEVGGDNPRYHFDNKISPWLNRANKNGSISNFKKNDTGIYFSIEQKCIQELSTIMPKAFTFKVTK